MLKPCRLTVFATDSKVYDYLNENLKIYGVQFASSATTTSIPRENTIVSIGPTDKKDSDDIMIYGRVAGPFKNCEGFFPAKGTSMHHASDVMIGFPSSASLDKVMIKLLEILFYLKQH